MTYAKERSSGLRGIGGAYTQMAVTLDQIPDEPELVAHRGLSTEQKVKKKKISSCWFPWKVGRGVSLLVPSLSGRENKTLRKAEKIPVLLET